MPKQSQPIHPLENNIKMATVLKKIVSDKIAEVATRKINMPLVSFKQKLSQSDRDFYKALTKKNSVFILECKKASPSKGLIRSDFDLKSIAKTYQNYADVISVLTDNKYFQGNFEFLPIVKANTTQPILCKDFIIDEYQIYLARYYKADAILLMLSILDDQEYIKLRNIAHNLNMGVLTEASNEEEAHRAALLNAKVIGINNRNLRDLTTDLNRVKTLAPLIPKDRIIISESGIYTHQNVLALSSHAHGFLIGSALMAETNLDLAVRKVIFGENKVCGLTRIEDALFAYQAGAVYGGLIFVESSPRLIDLPQAKKLIQAAPLNWVGVFRDKPIKDVVSIANELNLFAVQLHGNEDENYILELKSALKKNCHIWQAHSILNVIPKTDNPNIHRYIFDNGVGGSGQCFNWELLKKECYSNVILAGGISELNAEKAIQTGVIGLDMNSGAESSPAVKDPRKITTIFKKLKNYPYNKETKNV